VLEHPAFSTLWYNNRLPLPGGLPDGHNGYTIQLDQFHFGHKAEKRTWLYICGCPRDQLPEIPHRKGKPTHIIASSTQKAGRIGLKHLSKKDKLATPPAFAQWLVKVAKLCAV